MRIKSDRVRHLNSLHADFPEGRGKGGDTAPGGVNVKPDPMLATNPPDLYHRVNDAGFRGTYCAHDHEGNEPAGLLVSRNHPV